MYAVLFVYSESGNMSGGSAPSAKVAGMDVYILYCSQNCSQQHYNIISSTVLCCYNQVAVETSTFCTETSETIDLQHAMLYRESI